jgi:hypothetical protein
MQEYYVYVYIDPRNFQEFYFGKGHNSRKNAHLTDTSDSEKTRQIAAIRKAGLEPIIRVIAKDLSEHDALLVEKTLLWKLGRHLTNISSGHYASNFRPHDTMHVELSGFDFNNGIYYYNVGEGPHRNWDDYRQFGFISAGQGEQWRDALLGFQEGDVFAAYLKGKGYVGVGQIRDRARPIRTVTVSGKPLLQVALRSDGMNANVDSDELCEYVCTVDWKAAVDRSEAKWIAKSGLYTTPLIRASLDNQLATIEFLNQEFNLSMEEFVR